MHDCQLCDFSHECTEDCIMVVDAQTGEKIPESASGYFLIEEKDEVTGEICIVNI